MGAGARPPSGQQIKLMLEAFLDAFDRDELKEVVLLDMNERLDTIVADDNLRTTVFELIMWAKRQGRVAELINAAAGAKPKEKGMQALAAAAAGWGLEAPVVLPGGGAPPPPDPPVPQDNGPQLSATLALKMAYVPTAVIHLLDPAKYPLVQVQVTNTANRPRRLRVISGVEGYSTMWSDTVQLEPAGSANATATVLQQPVFTRSALRGVTEQLTVAIRTQVEDLDAQRIQLDMAKRITMLSINSAPVRVRDEATGATIDMLPYLGAFVTENEQSIQNYLKTVAGFHPDKKLAGYYAADTAGVRSQVRALSTALQQSGTLTYAPALVQTVAGSDYQRVRLPRECLSVGLANCLEGAALFCSLLQAMGLQSAIVWNREHAIIGWKENGKDDAPWRYLDTTKVNQGTFEKAMEWGDLFVEDNQGQPPEKFGILPIRELRAQGITPLE